MDDQPLSFISTIVPASLRQILENTEVFCSHNPLFSNTSPDACDWTGPIASLQKHIDDECRFSSLNPSSAQAGTQTELSSSAELQGHHGQDFKPSSETTCPLQKLPCPNACTDAACISREDLPDHLQHSCPLRIVKCPVISCTQKVLACELQQHMEDAGVDHLQSLSSLIQGVLEVLSTINGCRSMFIASARAKRYDVLQMLVRQSMANDDSPVHVEHDGDGRSILHRAAADGDAELVKALLQCDVSEEFIMALSTCPLGLTPLMLASLFGHSNVVKLLLEANSSDKHVLAKNKFHWTALMLACQKGHLIVVALLLKSNSSDEHLLARNKDGQTALMKACDYRQTEVMLLLMALNSSDEHLLAKDKNGETPLMLMRDDDTFNNSDDVAQQGLDLASH